MIFVYELFILLLNTFTHVTIFQSWHYSETSDNVTRMHWAVSIPYAKFYVLVSIFLSKIVNLRGHEIISVQLRCTITLFATTLVDAIK